jgi:hypothetical protein
VRAWDPAGCAVEFGCFAAGDEEAYADVAADFVLILDLGVSSMPEELEIS